MATSFRTPSLPRRRRPRPQAAPASLSDRAAHELRDAFERFAKLPRADQIALAEATVFARHSELCRGWPAIDSIGVGIRRRRDSRGRERHVREVCVVFTVARKWRKGAGAANPARLPSHLWVVLDPRERLLGAIPTDVVSRSALRGVRPQGTQRQIRADFPDRYDKATLACLIQTDALPGPYALCCKHVLSAPDILSGTNQGRVLNNGSGTEFGKSSVYYGAMGSDIISLDAQLAVIEDLAGARATMSALKFRSSIAQGTFDIPSHFFVHQPTEFGSTPLAASWVQFQYHDFTIPYSTPLGTANIHHQMLVQYQLDQGGSTQKGMSGAAVSSDPTGGMFLGMHIAGLGSDGLFIPAWLLIDGSQYGLSPESVLHPRGAADAG